MNNVMTDAELAAWLDRQSRCVGAGFISSSGDILFQECLGARPGYRAGYFTGSEVIAHERLDDMSTVYNVEWREDFAGRSFRVYRK